MSAQNTEIDLTLDDLHRIATEGVAAYSHMVEIGYGIGGLPDREIAANHAYSDTFDADRGVVVALIEGLMSVRRFAETRAMTALLTGGDQRPWLDLLAVLDHLNRPADGGPS